MRCSYLPFRFHRSDKFQENFDNLPKQYQERVRKELRKIKEFPIEHILHKAPFLKGEFAGIRKWRTADDIRIYFRVCKDCRNYNHDKQYKRCDNCERADDLIILVDVAIRKDDTYDNLDFNDKESKKFDDFSVNS